MANKDKSNMGTDESNKTVKPSILDMVVGCAATLCPFVVSIVEFASGNFVSGLGWCFAGVGWITAIETRKWEESLIELYRKHLAVCEKRDRAYKAKIQEYENRLSNEKNTTKSAAFDVENMSIDDVLKIGREFQKSDTWRGATHDTAKLLCDTIEMLRSKVKNEENKQ